MYAYRRGRRLHLDPSRSIGKGGEADVYDIGGDEAAKIFKSPDHPDLQGMPEEQAHARDRIIEHQRKLREFPTGLPQQVVVPVELLTDQPGAKVLGYVMQFHRGYHVMKMLSDRTFRESGFDGNAVVEIFRMLHEVVTKLHAKGVVIGDFNDMNQLVKPGDIRIIDADSMQFGQFKCHVFTKRFVDPKLCDPNKTSPMLIRPHTELSDWYAYAVMLMQSLLYVDPYGGVYRPKDKANKVPHDARALKGISVFHPEVIYPKPALGYGLLSDELLDYFHCVFVKGVRDVPNERLIQNIRWTTCSTCGTEHARPACPNCKVAAPAAIKQVVEARGKVSSTRLFETTGSILFATVQGGKLQWLYHEDGSFRREDKGEVVKHELNPNFRFRIQGGKTLFGQDWQMATVDVTRKIEAQVVDKFGNLPVFDANERARYWLDQGYLKRDGAMSSEIIGQVLTNQTLFWVGPKFGFGFYRAGALSNAFVFDAQAKGINDNVQMPRMSGQLVDATCVFTNDLCWFMYASKEDGPNGARVINRCHVLNSLGAVLASAQAEEDDESWLSTIRGKCAGGKFLFAPTDDGVVQVTLNGSDIVETKRFPDTEPFVNAASQLLPSKEGLYVVGRKAISLLKIA